MKSAKRFARLVSLTYSTKNRKRNVQKYFHEVLNCVRVTVKDAQVGTFKPSEIDKRLIYEAYNEVRSNRGSGGIDGDSIEEVEL